MDESPKARLKVLRDQLAAAAPRARIRAGTPPELLRRLETTAKEVGNLYLLVVSQRSKSEALDDAIDDALVEGHLLLHEVERAAPPNAPLKPTGRPVASVNRRQHERIETQVTVKLLRHTAKADHASEVTLDTETAFREARNVSVGGLFVTLAQSELPQVDVGSVVHVEVGNAIGARVFHARAVVTRRDASGLGLRWVDDSEYVRKDILALLDAMRRASQPNRLV